MSRFALDPRLLPYLPPTMAPCAIAEPADEADARGEGFLEHPREAFAEYRAAGVREVVCEEKHMGSRAVVLVCRSAAVARERFGASEGVSGAVYTRTGRPFFEDRATTERLLGRVRDCVERAGLWAELDTPWLLLDAELMPWSLKATGLLRTRYAAVGAAARSVFPAALGALEAAAARGVDVASLLDRQRGRAADAEAFTDAYRRYCWRVGEAAPGAGAAGSAGLAGIRLAPFHLLAVAGRSLAAVPHTEQLALIDRLMAAERAWCEETGDAAPEAAGPAVDRTRLLAPTRRLVVDTEDEASVAAGVAWWLDLTAEGGEGMVVKPVGALDRLADGEPLWRVHEAVFAVLALESEPVDPRL